MVALELYRAITLWNDVGYGRLLIEVKASEAQPSPALLKFQRALNIPAIQLFNQDGGFRLFSNDHQKILIVPARQWLATLPW
jgi:hypothetical protein